MGHKYSLMYEPEETVYHTLYLKTEKLKDHLLKAQQRMKTKHQSKELKQILLLSKTKTKKENGLSKACKENPFHFKVKIRI